jgi:hypothetical protein
MAAAKKPVLKELAGEALLYDLIDKLEDNRQRRRPIEAQLAPLEDEMKELKAKIMGLLDDLKLDKGRTTHATVSISEIERVVPDDINVAVKALLKDGYGHCIDFKVAAIKEYIEKKGKDVPGTHVEVVRRQLNHTSVK